MHETVLRHKKAFWWLLTKSSDVGFLYKTGGKEEAKCDSTPRLDCVALTIETKTQQFWKRNNFCSAWHFNMDLHHDVQGLTIVGGAQQWGEYIHQWDFKNAYIETYTNIKTTQKHKLTQHFHCCLVFILQPVKASRIHSLAANLLKKWVILQFLQCWVFILSWLLTRVKKKVGVQCI